MNGRSIRVLPQGGLGRMGHHHLVLDLGPDSFLLDCGSLFPGPVDGGVERILPPFDVARDRWAEGRLRGLLLTHGHQDHIGAVRDLLLDLPELPVFGTAFTLALLEAGFEDLRRRLSSAPRLLRVEQGRPLTLGRSRVTWFAITHSIPESSSVCIESPHGTVVHSGDFRVQAEPLLGPPCDEQGLRAVGDRGVDLALVDSTNSGRPGRTRPEREVAGALRRAIADTPGLAVVTLFSTHLERVLACLWAARATGRRLCVYGRSLKRSVELGIAQGLLPIRGSDRIGVDRLDRCDRGDVLLLVTGSQGEWRAPMARIARDEDPRVRLRSGDRVFFSARAVPGNERIVGAVINRLIDLGADVVAPWEREAGLHCSGHARSEEVVEWLSWLRPRYVMPVHGEAWHLREHERALVAAGIPRDHIVRARSGDDVLLLGDEPPCRRRPEGGVVKRDRWVTGLLTWDDDEPALRQRRAASMGAAVVVLLLGDGDRLLHAQVGTIGVFSGATRDAEEVDLIEDLLRQLRDPGGDLPRGEPLEERARLALRRAIRRRTGLKAVCAARLLREAASDGSAW